MTQNFQLLAIISDPILGPFEGEDFCVDEQGYIQVYDSDPKTAALIMPHLTYLLFDFVGLLKELYIIIHRRSTIKTMTMLI